MNGFGIAAVVATAVARFWGLTPMIVAGILGASLFFVGHYVVYMHIHESKLTLAQLRKSIDQLRPAG